MATQLLTGALCISEIMVALSVFEAFPVHESVLIHLLGKSVILARLPNRCSCLDILPNAPLALYSRCTPNLSIDVLLTTEKPVQVAHQGSFLVKSATDVLRAENGYSAMVNHNHDRYLED